MIQQNLVRLNVEEVYPQRTGTAHAGGFCRCDDGLDYAYKAAEHSAPFVPATEWLCTQLAQASRIQTPPIEIIYTENGSPWFGSRIEGGKLDEDECLLALQSGEMADRIIGLSERLSSIYALDLFVNNIDRHGKNYLFRTSLNRTILLAFDFSLAWLAHSPQLRGYPQPDTNTEMAHRFLASMYGFDVKSAQKTINAIAELPNAWIDGASATIPHEWKQGVDIDAAIEWWKSDERAARCEEIRGTLV
ncbi:HipA domain-containing protein [Pseudomonas chlororaphis]|uniref:HipA family kinase n=1 Tax=Pseudomonas chlororaphis TaxID=587753 RepID=UPI0012318C97|nr:HipA family kinase [Pseudomonas chlororaphis]KAA5834858.1 HipA domain-containing protein [Pseudomonas chlororaphis]